MKRFLLTLLFALLLYGFISAFATIIHETGHLLFAYSSGATNLSYKFDLLGASFANWTGERSSLTTMGGVIFSILIGLPFVYIFFTTKSNIYMRIAMIMLIIEFISNSFFYIAISILIKWGDGYTLVESYSFNKVLLFSLCFICGTLLSAISIAKFFSLNNTTFQKRYLHIFVLCFFSVIFISRLLSKSFFVYTFDYILLINMIIALLIIHINNPLKVNLINERSERSPKFT